MSVGYVDDLPAFKVQPIRSLMNVKKPFLMQSANL